jgi:hypothetical protein
MLAREIEDLVLCFDFHCEPLTSTCRNKPEEEKAMLCGFVSLGPKSQSYATLC